MYCVHTCTTETKEILDPVSDGGLDNLLSGLAEYAEGEADRTFKTYKKKTIRNQIKVLSTLKLGNDIRTQIKPVHINIKK